MRIWKVGTGTSGGWSSYDELKKRKVVAQGWRDMGNLSQLRDQGLPKQPFIALLQKAHPDVQNPENVYRIFTNLLVEMKQGDLVLAYDGTDLKGIGEVVGTDYTYDDSYDYAHGIGPVEWLDIDITGKSLKEIGAGTRGVRGIVKLGQRYAREVEEVLQLIRGRSKMVNQRNRSTRLDLLVSLIDRFPAYRALILHGPPGTGKTRLAKQIAAHLLGITDVEAALDRDRQEYTEFYAARFAPPKRGNGRGAWAIVQFHPSYSYEDFVRGVVIQGSGSTVTYQTTRRLLDEIALEAAQTQNQAKKYVLIIDEINRANLAAVLGELIYALEYRNEPVYSLYGIRDSSGQLDHRIILPDNLYIIGTMNTADRSVGRIDYAVRRRFTFVPLYPDSAALDYAVKDAHLRDLAKDMFEAVGRLFSEEGCLSPEFHADDVRPGHSYFIAESCEELLYKFVYQVVPLLREYVKDGVLVPKVKNHDIIVKVRDTNIAKLNKPEPPEALLAELCKLCQQLGAIPAGVDPDQEPEAGPTDSPAENASSPIEGAEYEGTGDKELWTSNGIPTTKMAFQARVTFS